MVSSLDWIDRLDCQRLAVDFARHVDHGDVESVVSLFTDDAVFERRGETLRGKHEIREAQLRRSKSVVTRHLCTNIAVDMSGDDRATGVVSFILFRHDHAAARTDAGKPAPLGVAETVGEYHDEYRRTGDGWRIARRVARAAFRRQA